MKANELRIGNWVMEKSSKEPVQVDLIDSQESINGYAGISGYEPNPIEWYAPIPLTEEWLLKFGFHIDKVKAHKKYNDIGNIFQLNRVNERFEFTWGAVEIQYVHSLQNLYFALTGEELTIKP